MKCSHESCPNDLPPGAYCDGNGSHPPRRAKRLTGDERRTAQREAETRREAERTRAALVAVARPAVESAQQRRYLYRCGDLAGELAEAVKVGLITWEEAARLEAETAAEVAAMDAERARKRAEYEAWLATNPPSDAVDVGALAEPRSEPRRHTSHRRAIGIVALAGALMGVGGLTREDI